MTLSSPSDTINTWQESSVDDLQVLPLDCVSLDQLLLGGLERGVITKVYGEAGSGKTTMCLQAARECVKKDFQVVFLDTEGVSVKRLRQLCASQEMMQTVLDHMKFFSPTSFAKQEEVLKEVFHHEHVGLVIVDTMNLLYRLALEDEYDSARRGFIRQMSTLQLNARLHNAWVLIAEQVYTDKKGVIQPFTHKDTGHMVKTMLRLDKLQGARRKAVITKHRCQPEGASAVFSLTQGGLE